MRDTGQGLQFRDCPGRSGTVDTYVANVPKNRKLRTYMYYEESWFDQVDAGTTVQSSIQHTTVIVAVNSWTLNNTDVQVYQ